MIKKENKIIVVVSPDPQERLATMKHLAVKLGFCAIPSDAQKIIRADIYSIDLPTSYFVFCSYYDFRKSSITTQILYEMSARGIAVVLGVKQLPKDYEFICQAFFPSDFNLIRY